MPEVETFTPPSTPTPIGPYNHVARAGDLIMIGATAGVDPATGSLAGDDVGSQVTQILDGFRVMLDSVGSDLAHVVHVTVFLARMGDFDAMNAAYVAGMGDHRPARTVIGVSELPKPGVLVTINLTAVTSALAGDTMNLVLIHGSYFGSWSWQLVTPELERLGHRVTAVDLPISERGLGASDYADVVISGSDWADAPVLIAHSMSGLVAPIVAARREVRRMIFIASFLPKPGLSAMDQRAAEPIDPTTPPTTFEFVDLGEGLWSIGNDTAREMFMHDASDAVVEWALPQLRPQFYGVMSEITPLVEWPDVASDYVVCRDDRATNPEWGRRAARERLGVVAREIDGGHSPMLSRPTELATLLDDLVRS